ncbi:tripartite tricarboxylate transporter receptor protein [Variovorax sp. WS11]|uniref:tripartite tricarboxylate transporter substrate binding protein n=1 Tax=Variovorax sp. WS11 TaxID=1105204 RepID=UPI000D0D5F5F|nr:tripartite tricarboxylate transporter substrate binding protein [Variovorax sp. WS11]NDZ11928.1 tripartite tricarboxylate transporter substrate binding protein [Variovorax sp. WS11]PSL82687.1 tripartite tricarboxylate transporter receptor protein [Variovorax sp. WS11]
MERRQFLAGAGATLAALGAAPMRARAAAYPDKPIRLVVPFGAGGVADLTARAVGQALGQRLGQSVVVDNRPGAGGVVAGDAVAKAAPDGYTLLLMSNGTAVSEGLFKRLPFDARKDFAPISLLGRFDLALVVPGSSKFKNLQELLDAARQQPGKLNLGTVNVGSTQHLSAELLKLSAQVDLQVVPFNGTPAVLTALRGGQIDAAIEILSPLMPQIQAQGVRALAVLGDGRSPLLPQVPTAAESAGLKGFEVSSWNALAAPAKTPPDIVARLASEARQVLESAALKKQLADLNVQARASSPEQLAALLDSEIKRWSDVIARAKIPRQ